MRRRDFIKVIVGSVAAWPSTALAQQPNIMRRIGVLTNLPESDPEAQSRNAAFLERMRQLGWRDGGNLRIEFRYALGAA
jgi:putative tryptophan/tyrosine transport system substrate-binding protein